MNNDLPIGVIDSGIGGLTVLSEISKLLPKENLIYLGDTARVPYGTRNKDTINKFALELTEFLLKKKIKALVIACNTMSAVSLSEIKRTAGNIPVIDVISPTVSLALSRTDANVLGVIGTAATVNSRAYDAQIKKKNKAIKILSVACPLFVPLAEEGLVNGPAIKFIAKEYLSAFNKTKIDTLILGCTHYPLIRNVISQTVGENIKLIESGKPTAEQLEKVLKNSNSLNIRTNPKIEIYLTDVSERVYKMIDSILGKKFTKKIKKAELK